MKNKTNKSGCAMSRIKCSAINKDKHKSNNVKALW